MFNQTQKGIVLILLSSLTFSLVGVCVKYLSHIPGVELVFFRALIALIITFFMLKRKRIPIWGHNKKLLILRGIFGFGGLMMSFISFQLLPLASASTLFHLFPIFTVAFSYIILKETATRWQWAGILVAFSGGILVQGFTSVENTLYTLIPIGGAVCAGIAYNIIRLLKGRENPLVIIFYFPFVTVPLVTPFMLRSFVMPQATDWLVILMIGVLTQIGQLLLTAAYQAEASAKISVFNYLGLFWSALWGLLFFAEVPAVGVFLGIFVIISGSLLATLFKNGFHRKAKAAIPTHHTKNGA